MNPDRRTASTGMQAAPRPVAGDQPSAEPRCGSPPAPDDEVYRSRVPAPARVLVRARRAACFDCWWRVPGGPRTLALHTPASTLAPQRQCRAAVVGVADASARPLARRSRDTHRGSLRVPAADLVCVRPVSYRRAQPVAHTHATDVRHLG